MIHCRQVRPRPVMYWSVGHIQHPPAQRCAEWQYVVQSPFRPVPHVTGCGCCGSPIKEDHKVTCGHNGCKPRRMHIERCMQCAAAPATAQPAASRCYTLHVISFAISDTVRCGQTQQASDACLGACRQNVMEPLPVHLASHMEVTSHRVKEAHK